MKTKYKLKQMMEATILCIRFPFLYPVNRFTGLHYNSYKVLNFKSKLMKYKKYTFLDEKYENAEILNKDDFWYFRKRGGFISYWENWWAPIAVFAVTFYHDVILQLLHCIPTYTELSAFKEVPVWYDTFAIDWAKDVRKGLIKHYGFKSLFKYKITQIKEKWGEFTWYYPPEKLEYINNKYVNLSRSICCECGKKATKVTPVETYTMYYCDNCAPPFAEPIVED